ncbi:hypothetical protein [Hymenobacter norwichensis]|uniref:hypothetical protein n=1 Tax=Hymenobacter norwichensis TaxID=223903 RepID=UPI0003B6392A|nr:hypothetical protein [Hymenobacter norwichensis]
MRLTGFLQDLFMTGAVSLAGEPAPFEAEDLHAAVNLLRVYHAEDALDMPHTAPAFDAPAAQWAATYLYCTALLALVRTLDEQVIAHYLPDFPGNVTAEVVYSVDLPFRYLPDLLHLAKGLAPGDVLVTRLQATARQWPFSFVGHELAEPGAETPILAHPALRQAYVDRIIAAQDRPRAQQPHLLPLVQTALGGHVTILWPDFELFILPSS